MAMAIRADAPANTVDFSQLAYVYWAWRVSCGVTYAAFTIMIWDMFLTLADEVAFVWPAKLTVVKGLFLFNRYISPIVLGMNIWTFSGYARNLSDTFCQGWLTIAFLIQTFCTSMVSLVIALQLRAFYETSRRTFIILLCIWAVSFAAAIAILVKNFFLHLNSVTFLPAINMCIVTVKIPTAWATWLPSTIEHSLLCIFLIFNALSTPRSSRIHLLASMYQQGIFYFAMTFGASLFGLITWRFIRMEWFALPLYTIWILEQILMSRLLLNVKSSQAFQEPLLVTQKVRGKSIHRAPTPQNNVVLEMDRVLSPDRGGIHLYPRGLSPRALTPDGECDVMSDGDAASKVFVAQQPATLSSKIPWWARPKKSYGDLHVQIECEDEGSLQEGDEGGGVRVSRLGRYDHWL